MTISNPTYREEKVSKSMQNALQRKIEKSNIRVRWYWVVLPESPVLRPFNLVTAVAAGLTRNAVGSGQTYAERPHGKIEKYQIEIEGLRGFSPSEIHKVNGRLSLHLPGFRWRNT